LFLQTDRQRYVEHVRTADVGTEVAQVGSVRKMCRDRREDVTTVERTAAVCELEVRIVQAYHTHGFTVCYVCEQTVVRTNVYVSLDFRGNSIALCSHAGIDNANVNCT